MTASRRRAAVWLGDVLVGHIWPAGGAGCTFALDPRYQRQPGRPVLGARFEDMRRPRRYPTAVPTWFANLLPEGMLRDLIAVQRGAHGGDDFDLLVTMGGDLPGNVRVTIDDTDDAVPPAESSEHSRPPESAPTDGLIKFSLAGVQLKFSMYSDRKRTLRLTGTRDDTAMIVKTPDAVHPHACENEFVVMSWAAACGIEVPKVELVPIQHLEGLPPRLPIHGDVAYAIERYDRTASGRVHQEDFCQVLDRPPTSDGKYRGSSYEEVVRLVAQLADRDRMASLREFVRRLVFVIASGNGDAHLKNWSFVYPDGLHAGLSPAYDLMATIVYPQYAKDELALPLDSSQRFAAVTRRSFRGIARHAGLDEALVMSWVDDAVRRTLDAWQGSARILADTIDMPDGFVATLEEHLERVPLLASHAG